MDKLLVIIAYIHTVLYIMMHTVLCFKHSRALVAVKYRYQQEFKFVI